MKLDCILDTCPKNKKFVNHLNCITCKYNPLGEEQPEFACQECNHPEAEHKPDLQRWQNMKLCGAEALSVVMTRKC